MSGSILNFKFLYKYEHNFTYCRTANYHSWIAKLSETWAREIMQSLKIRGIYVKF